MGKCTHCGKKGLFLKLNARGMCKNCAEKERQETEKRAKAENLEFEANYSKMLSWIGSLQGSADLGNDAIAALELIPQYQNKVELCDSLWQNIHNPRFEKLLLNKLIANISYRDEISARYKWGTLRDWDVSVSADPVTKEYSAEKIYDALDRKIREQKNYWLRAIDSIKKSAEFQKKIDAIPSIEVYRSDVKYRKQGVSALDEIIKYSNITARTSFDKIGSFVVLDVETTGLSSTRDALVEVAAIRFEDWEPVEKFHSLLNPGKHIPEEATAINNITDEMVAEAPTFSQVIDCLKSFVGKANIVGHNLPFDLKFLYRYGFDFTVEKRKYFDTCEIAKKILKKPKMKWDREYEEYVINDNYDYDVEDYKLTTLSDFYQIRDNAFAHRAMSDAFATGLLFKKLAQTKIDY